VRGLFFLMVSGTAHFLGARWFLSVSPWARARGRRVWMMAALLSLVLPTLRVVSWRVPRSAVFSDLIAGALIELSIALLSLPILGVIVLVSRVGGRIAGAVSPPAEPRARITRREAIERGAGLASVGVTSLALGWGAVRGRHSFTIEEIAIRVPGWPRALDGYVIAQVSDIHVGAWVGDRELDEGFELVRRVRPDLLVATGDLVDDEAGLVDPLLLRMEAIDARDGAFAILGNHDHYAGAAAVERRIRASKIRLLDNESARIRETDGGGFALLGVDDLQGRFMNRGRGPDLGRALAGVPDVPKILLAHQPRYFLESQGRVDLQLSGHTHGGQINPGFRPAAAFMEFIAGKYERSGSTLYVNRGYGVTGPPSRIRAAPEITKLVIVAA
jgi:uncharacterized protein